MQGQNKTVYAPVIYLDWAVDHNAAIYRDTCTEVRH